MNHRRRHAEILPLSSNIRLRMLLRWRGSTCQQRPRPVDRSSRSVPLSVSVASNVPGHEPPRCYATYGDSDKLVGTMTRGLSAISDTAFMMLIPSYEHSQTASRFKDISPKVVSAGLVIYSGLHQIILHSPSTPSTRGQRDGRDHVEPLPRDGVTSSAKI